MLGIIITYHVQSIDGAFIVLACQWRFVVKLHLLPPDGPFAEQQSSAAEHSLLECALLHAFTFSGAGMQTDAAGGGGW